MNLTNRIEKLEKLKISSSNTLMNTTISGEKPNYEEKRKCFYKQCAIDFQTEAQTILAHGVKDLKKTLYLLCRVISNINTEAAKENLSSLHLTQAFLVEALNRSGENWQLLFEQEFAAFQARRERRKQQIIEEHDKYNKMQHDKMQKRSNLR